VFKFVWKTFFLIVLIGVLSILARNSIGIWLTQRSLQNLTGAPSSVDSLQIDLLQPHVVAKDIVIRNPKGAFQEPVAIKINRLEMNYDVVSMRRFEPYFHQMILDVYEINVVRNKKGELNLEWIASKNSNASGNAHPIRIDELLLSLQNVRYLDERVGMASPIGYKINLQNRRYTQIRTADDVKKLLIRLAVESLPEKLGLSHLRDLSSEVLKNPPALDRLQQGVSTLFGKPKENSNP